MKEKQCEIFGLAETNTNWQSNNIKTNIDRIIKTQFVNSSTILSSNRYNPDNNERFQPGGTLQACMGHWKSCCLLTIHDSRNMGRSTGQRFQLKHNKTITIITAYRPCKQNININKPTSSTTYRQQVIMLTEEGIINPDPRKIFMDDIINVINEHSHNDNYIILMLDANENVNDTESGLDNLLQQTKLLDTFSYIGNDECNVPTFARGSKKIDYILTSATLIPYINNVGCLTFYMHNNSDHRGLFIDISKNLIDDKVELKQPAIRNIGSKCSGYEIYTYNQYIDKQFQIHKIYEKTNNLPNLSMTTTIREMEKF
jgi:hypothetical protein